MVKTKALQGFARCVVLVVVQKPSRALGNEEKCCAEQDWNNEHAGERDLVREFGKIA
jgi:hypothetical protein